MSAASANHHLAVFCIQTAPFQALLRASGKVQPDPAHIEHFGFGKPRWSHPGKGHPVLPGPQSFAAVHIVQAGNFRGVPVLFRKPPGVQMAGKGIGDDNSTAQSVHGGQISGISSKRKACSAAKCTLHFAALAIGCHPHRRGAGASDRLRFPMEEPFEPDAGNAAAGSQSQSTPCLPGHGFFASINRLSTA